MLIVTDGDHNSKRPISAYNQSIQRMADEKYEVFVTGFNEVTIPELDRLALHKKDRMFYNDTIEELADQLDKITSSWCSRIDAVPLFSIISLLLLILVVLLVIGVIIFASMKTRKIMEERRAAKRNQLAQQAAEAAAAEPVISGPFNVQGPVDMNVHEHTGPSSPAQNIPMKQMAPNGRSLRTGRSDSEIRREYYDEEEKFEDKHHKNASEPVISGPFNVQGPAELNVHEHNSPASPAQNIPLKPMAPKGLRTGRSDSEIRREYYDEWTREDEEEKYAEDQQAGFWFDDQSINAIQDAQNDDYFAEHADEKYEEHRHEKPNSARDHQDEIIDEELFEEHQHQEFYIQDQYARDQPNRRPMPPTDRHEPAMFYRHGL
eukprot:263186_1